MKNKIMFVLLSIFLMTLSVPFALADYYTYNSGTNSQTNIQLLYGANATINPGTDTAITSISNLRPTANLTGISVQDSFLGTTLSGNSYFHWRSQDNFTWNLTMMCPYYSVQFENTTLPSGQNVTDDYPINLTMGATQVPVALEHMTPVDNFSIMVNSTLTGTNTGGYATLTWATPGYVNFSDVNITNSTQQLTTDNYTLANISEDVWALFFLDNHSGEAITFTANRTFIAGYDDIITRPDSINRDGLDYSYYITNTSNYVLGGYFNVTFTGIYSAFFNNTNWAFNWTYNETIGKTVPTTNYTLMQNGTQWYVTWLNGDYDGLTCYQNLTTNFSTLTDFIANASDIYTGATTANFIAYTVPATYDGNVSIELTPTGIGRYFNGTNWTGTWVETNRTLVSGAVDTPTNAGMANTRTMLYAAFGLLAVMIIALVAFAIVTFFQTGSIDLMAVTVMAIGGGIILVVGYVIIYAVFKALGGF